VRDAFGYVLFGVVGVGVLLALGSLLIKTKTYEQIGSGGFFKEEGPAAKETSAVRDEEIRQLLRARNSRHSTHGGEIVDVEDELARLTAPSLDPALVEEIREFVVKRNERRVARGQEPLDVDAEVERRVREMS
jgi:hypothetical protein